MKREIIKLLKTKKEWLTTKNISILLHIKKRKVSSAIGSLRNQGYIAIRYIQNKAQYRYIE